jgi:FKBP-type peptidyl-prolyl cis-trans isomerase
MATPKSQRIGIWVIAIVLAVGTLGSFLVMGLSINNQKIDQAQQEKQYEQYLTQQKVVAQFNADNSLALTGYSPSTFDPSSVTKLKVEVLKEGTGATVKATDTVKVSYFGWMSSGEIFDSSTKKSATDQPASFALKGVISGWTNGLTGQKVGSTLRLTIPADEAYGDQVSGIIPANSPLEFIVEIHSIG